MSSFAPPLAASSRRRRTRFAILGALVVATTLLVAGCETESTGVEANVTSLHDNYLHKCASCHAPAAAGRTSDTEQSLDFSTAEMTSKSLREGKATGLKGNTAGCNDVPFVKAGKPELSLIVAVLDEDVRKAFDDPDHSSCDNTAISAMDIRAGGAPSAEFLTALKQWITDGAKP